ncbi:hypothetical protein [Pedobacter rhizosphaerae]|uniref:hypothetical protein n=1 Tax=Pedobacter rhizosphaerae TaxID=390241 RepID=UPI0011133B7D|nr:hypothetical protein [Pedobacter rhizosphaerae]
MSKAVEQHSEVNNVLPSYKKMGYGVKLNFEKAKYMLGLNLFQAKDNLNSFPKSLDSLMISPQENLVIGAEVRIRPLKGLELSSELATSALTRDSRDSTPKPRHTNFLGWLSKANHTTSFYTAFKMQMNYT